MKIAVRYYTKTGNTKRLAEAVAEAVGVQALPIDITITNGTTATDTPKDWPETIFRKLRA